MSWCSSRTAHRCWANGGADYCRYVDPAQEWPGLQSLMMVKATRRMGDTVSTETRYFISSRPPLARLLLAVVGA